MDMTDTTMHGYLLTIPRVDRNLRDCASLCLSGHRGYFSAAGIGLASRYLQLVDGRQYRGYCWTIQRYLLVSPYVTGSEWVWFLVR